VDNNIEVLLFSSVVAGNISIGTGDRDVVVDN
jgi:hypothetical protein